jgi:hypothetical protein
MGSMEAWKDNHFKFTDFPKGIAANGEWSDLRKTDLSEIEYLIIWHHRNLTKDLTNLPIMPKLKYLEINWSATSSLNGIERFPSLKRLELHNCTKLETIQNICSLKKSIEYIHFNVCKKISDHQKVVCCKQLKTLCFNECGKTESISFLSLLSELEDFRFVHTNILDGNLMPLIEHYKIKSVGFLNKRHYSHKDTEIDELIKAKNS